MNAHLPPDDAARAHADLGYPRHRQLAHGRVRKSQAKRAVRFHEEVLRRAGSLGVPLRVGESIALDSLRTRPAPRLEAVPTSTR